MKIILSEKPDSRNRYPEPGEMYIFTINREAAVGLSIATKEDVKMPAWNESPEKYFIIDDNNMKVVEE